MSAKPGWTTSVDSKGERHWRHGGLKMGTWYANFFKQDASRIVEWLNKCVRDIDCGLAIAGPVEGFEAAATEIDRLRAERDKWVEYATGDRALVLAALIASNQEYCADNIILRKRIAELEDHAVLATLAKNNDQLRARIANCTDYINGLLGNMADDDKERVIILIRAESAEADCAAVIVDTARELGCFADNEGILAAIATLRADYKRAEAELKAMREVLEPFANEYDESDSFWWAPDDNSSVSINRRESDLVVGDFRKARAALAPSPADEK